jgi:hypothetical protein
MPLGRQKETYAGGWGLITGGICTCYKPRAGSMIRPLVIMVGAAVLIYDFDELSGTGIELHK